MQIVLIGNYPADKQESMERFALMMDTNNKKAGLQSVIWRPIVLFGLRFSSTSKGIGKFFGYVDKWLIFPFVIYYRWFKLKVPGSEIHFHICDHGNAPYLMFLPKDRTVVTCHDVLAIKSAMGDTDTFTTVSGPGKYYQKWILNYLNKAKRIAFVSNRTLLQFLDLEPGEPHDRVWQVIHNSFNARFERVSKCEVESLMQKIGVDFREPFILHVGSGSPRKNRKMLLDILNSDVNPWKGQVCFAGEAVEPELYKHAEALGFSKRIISVLKPDHKTLLALYQSCEALVFPSFSEGFGWPIIEAQACACPVITSDIEPMPEIGGYGALYADPHKPEEFAKALSRLKDGVTRKQLIHLGLENAKRFDQKRMIERYLELYGYRQQGSFRPCQELQS